MTKQPDRRSGTDRRSGADRRTDIDLRSVLTQDTPDRRALVRRRIDRMKATPDEVRRIAAREGSSWAR